MLSPNELVTKFNAETGKAAIPDPVDDLESFISCFNAFLSGSSPPITRDHLAAIEQALVASPTLKAAFDEDLEYIEYFNEDPALDPEARG